MTATRLSIAASSCVTTFPVRRRGNKLLDINRRKGKNYASFDADDHGAIVIATLRERSREKLSSKEGGQIPRTIVNAPRCTTRFRSYYRPGSGLSFRRCEGRRRRGVWGAKRGQKRKRGELLEVDAFLRFVSKKGTWRTHRDCRRIQTTSFPPCPWRNDRVKRTFRRRSIASERSPSRCTPARLNGERPKYLHLS